MMQPLTIRRPEHDRPPDVVKIVRRCRTKRLTAPDKLAYQFLHAETEGGRRAVLTTPSDIADDQGTTSDAGRTRLKNLKEVGLIDYRPAQKSGSYEVWLLDPFAALRSLGEIDPQLDLPFENTSWEGLSESQAGQPGDAQFSQDGINGSQGRRIGPALADAEDPLSGEDPPEDPREVPRFETARRPLGLSERDCAHTPLSTIRKPSELSDGSSSPVALAAEVPRRGSSGGSSADFDFDAEVIRRREQLKIPPPADELDVKRVVAIASTMARRVPSERDQAASREHWIDTIRRRVNDPKLAVSVMAKVACAIVRGELEVDVVEQILASLQQHRREGTLRADPGIYFFKSARRAFEERGLTWLAYHKPKPR